MINVLAKKNTEVPPAASAPGLDTSGGDPCAGCCSDLLSLQDAPEVGVPPPVSPTPGCPSWATGCLWFFFLEHAILFLGTFIFFCLKRK